MNPLRIPHATPHPPPKTRQILPLLLALAALLLLPACETHKKNLPPDPLPGRVMEQVIQVRASKDLIFPMATTGPSGEEITVPVFAWPPGFLRVAWLPLHPHSPTYRSLYDLDAIFRAECSKVLPLEVVPVSRNDMLQLLGRESIASTDIIPASFIRQLMERYGVQGILFTDLTLYRPYRPISIGVRGKLVQAPHMTILWSADGILDSAEPGIASSALEFARRNLRGPQTGAAEVILQSPRRYAAFAANALYGTLPGQLYGVPPKPKPTPVPGYR